MSPTDDEQLDRLLEAVSTLGSNLDVDDVLQRVASLARSLMNAKYGAIGVLNEDKTALAQFIHDGIDDETAAAIGPLPEGKGILGRIIHHPVPLLLPHLENHPESFGFPEHHPSMDSFIGVPITAHGEVFGNLYLTDKRDGEFSAADERFAVALARVAGAFIENAALHERVKNIAIVEDRERIARDLHDTVLQRIFGAGLQLQRIAKAGDDKQRIDIEHIIEELDAIMGDIRSSIFSLQPYELTEGSVREQLVQVIDRVTLTSRLVPAVHLDGRLAADVPPAIAQELIAVLEEGLANVVKHAEATHVDIEVRIENGELMFDLIDDGRGTTGPRLGGQGLQNMEHRAKRLGGEFSCQPAAQGGTHLHWQVPLS